MGRIPYHLQPEQLVQFDPFAAVGLGSGLDAVAAGEVQVEEGGPVAGYASVVDNGTQDPILLPLVRLE